MQSILQPTTMTAIWWSKLGKWQLLMTVIAVATFYIKLYFTGDVVLAALAAALVAVIVYSPAIFAATLPLFSSAPFAAFSSYLFVALTASSLNFRAILIISIILAMMIIVKISAQKTQEMPRTNH